MHVSTLRFMDESSTTRTVGFHVSAFAAAGGSTGTTGTSSELTFHCIGMIGRPRVTDSICFPSGSSASGIFNISIKDRLVQPAKASSGDPNVISIDPTGRRGFGTITLELLTVTGNLGNSALNSSSECIFDTTGVMMGVAPALADCV